MPVDEMPVLSELWGFSGGGAMIPANLKVISCCISDYQILSGCLCGPRIWDHFPLGAFRTKQEALNASLRAWEAQKRHVEAYIAQVLEALIPYKTQE